MTSYQTIYIYFIQVLKVSKLCKNKTYNKYQSILYIHNDVNRYNTTTPYQDYNKITTNNKLPADSYKK